MSICSMRWPDFPRQSTTARCGASFTERGRRSMAPKAPAGGMCARARSCIAPWNEMARSRKFFSHQPSAVRLSQPAPVDGSPDAGRIRQGHRPERYRTAGTAWRRPGPIPGNRLSRHATDRRGRGVPRLRRDARAERAPPERQPRRLPGELRSACDKKGSKPTRSTGRTGAGSAPGHGRAPEAGKDSR